MEDGQVLFGAELREVLCDKSIDAHRAGKARKASDCQKLARVTARRSGSDG
jgi:hypothetical protein